MTVESTLRRPGYPAQGAAAEASNSRFLVRPASAADIPSLEQVERDAFPEQWPPTKFASEIRKTDALYLIAPPPEAAPPLAAPAPSASRMASVLDARPASAPAVGPDPAVTASPPASSAPPPRTFPAVLRSV